MYKTTMKQLGIHNVKIEHNNKQETCHFFVVLGNSQALPGMPDRETLNVLTINCTQTEHNQIYNKAEDE